MNDRLHHKHEVAGAGMSSMLLPFAWDQLVQLGLGVPCARVFEKRHGDARDMVRGARMNVKGMGGGTCCSQAGSDNGPVTRW